MREKMLAINLVDLTAVPQVSIQHLFAGLEQVTTVMGNSGFVDDAWLVFRGPAGRISELDRLLKQWRADRTCLIRHRLVTRRWITNRRPVEGAS